MPNSSHIANPKCVKLDSEDSSKAYHSDPSRVLGGCHYISKC